MKSLLRALFGGTDPEPMQDAAALRDRLGDTHPPLLLDVREPTEFQAGHIPGAVNLPLGQLRGRLAWVKQQRRPVVVACLSETRSRRGAAALRTAGVEEVSVLRGGTAGWARQGFPLTPGA